MRHKLNKLNVTEINEINIFFFWKTQRIHNQIPILHPSVSNFLDVCVCVCVSLLGRDIVSFLSDKLVYIGACLGVVLLALSVVLLLVFRHRNRYFHASPGIKLRL